jgi:hypothetical protein
LEGYCGDGTELNEAINKDDRPVYGALKHDDVVQVSATKGRSPLGPYLCCRVRYCCGGAMFESREFVGDVVRTFRSV